MKKLSLIALLFLIASCAPRTVPAADPIFYKGSVEEIYAAVVQAISTSPGLDNSDGWGITQSDAAGGFVRVETTVKGGFFSGDRQEAVTVIVSQNTDSRTQVVIQASAGATPLSEKLQAELDSKFLRGN